MHAKSAPNTTCFYDAKDLGEGTPQALDGDHYAYNDLNKGLIYDGEVLGVKGVLPQLANGHVAYVQFPQNPGGEAHVIYDGKDLGPGTQLVLDGDNYAYADPETRHIVYNGRDVGEGYGSTLALQDGHVAFSQSTKYGGHLIYDGKDIGEASTLENSIALAGDHIAFVRTIAGKEHVIFDGKDLGEGRYPVVSRDGHVAFQRALQVQEPSGIIYVSAEVILDDKSLGEGVKPQFS